MIIKGLIIFAHGSRRDSWRQPFDNLLIKLKNNLKLTENTFIELAFLEIMQPSLNEILHSLAEKGCLHIDICPIFLGKGGHIERDLADIINNFNNKNISINILPTIGEREEVLNFIANDIFQQIN